MNAALIAYADDFLISLPAVDVLLIERVAFSIGTPPSVRIAPTNAVRSPADRLSQSPMFDMILHVNGFLGSFKTIYGLGNLPRSHFDPVSPLLVEGNTNS
ncbi:hypothetical protein AVEN_65856-1 [Araneus ventricosus]|uniref:Uncharacterized protein n=1 Tax=Araneus ventricosus TaxID=182803 RepID=A0A4Y2SBI6_ARAVE|nr:hypothetical protein AVEN_65856-1 [Araneus ventricosus]